MEINVYVDMDGVQAIYGLGDSIEEMSKVGYFRNRPVQKNVIDFIKKLSEDDRFNVAILSAVFDDDHSKEEKRQWLIENGLGGVNAIFTPCGACKAYYITTSGLNILIDDYSKNLFEWESQGKNFLGIKFDNGINGNSGKWKSHGGFVLKKEMSAEAMCWFMGVVAEMMEAAYRIFIVNNGCLIV